MFDKTQKKILIVLSLIFIALLTICIYMYRNRETLKEEQFVKPTFDKNMVMGTPTGLDSTWNYSKLTIQEGKTITLCATPVIKENALQLYLTSDADNDFWLRVRVLNQSKRIIGESGLLDSGSYIKEIPLKKKIKAGKKITLYLMMYEKDTYQSAGAAALEITVGG